MAWIYSICSYSLKWPILGWWCCGVSFRVVFSNESHRTDIDAPRKVVSPVTIHLNYSAFGLAWDLGQRADEKKEVSSFDCVTSISTSWPNLLNEILWNVDSPVNWLSVKQNSWWMGQIKWVFHLKYHFRLALTKMELAKVSSSKITTFMKNQFELFAFLIITCSTK